MQKQTAKKPLLALQKPVLLGASLLLVGIALLAQVMVKPQSVEATTSSTINFQARLLTAAGSVVPDGYYNVEFKLYDVSSGGTALWTETRTSGDTVRVVNGYLTVNLGSVTAFPGTINWDQELWLTMNIGGTGTPSWDGEMNPRLKLTAVPYSLRSGELVGGSGSNTTRLDTGTPSGNNLLHLPAESGTLCVQNSSNCGFMPTTSGVQLQPTTPGTQQTGNFNLSGTGILGTALTTPIVDNAGSLSIGTSNATGLTLGRSSINTSLTGSNVFITGNTSVLAGSTFNVQSGWASITGLNTTSSTPTLTVNSHATGASPLVVQSADTTVLTVANGGSTQITTTINATNAFAVQGTAATDVLAADTYNNTVHLRTVYAGNMSTYDAIWLQGNKNGVTAFVGGNDDTNAYTSSDVSGNLRFNGSNVAWGDFGYYPRGGGDGNFGQFRLSTTGSAIDSTPNAKLGVGSLYAKTNIGINNVAPAYELDVTGSAHATTSALSPLFDVASAGALGVGTASATSISIGSNTNNSAITLNSGTGAIAIGTGAQARTVDLATGAAAQTVTVGSLTTTSSATVQGGTGTSAVNIQSGSGGTINIGNSGVAGTINIGNVNAGAVAQAITIGTNSTSGSTTNTTIGSSVAGTVSLVGGVSIANRSSGTADTLVVSNSTSTGTILKLQDDATTVMQVNDGGATLFNVGSQTNALRIQNTGGNDLLNVDSSTNQVTIGSSSLTTQLNVTGNIVLGTTLDTAQSFEGATFPPTSPGTWTTGGDANWTRTTSTASDGSASAQSGTITDSQSTWLDLNYTFAQSGSLVFSWRVDSEEGWDYLVLCVDNDAGCSRTTGYTSRISGSTGWMQMSVAASAGAHSFRWLYAKDSTDTVGSDMGWVDNVRFLSGSGNITGSTIQVASSTDLTLTSGGNIVLGTVDATGTLLVLDHKTDSGDPSGADGGMYYNAYDDKFRCYEGGVWKDCITEGPLISRYYATASQSLNNNSDNQINFPYTDQSDGLVSVTNNNIFTLNRSGIWEISATMRFSSATGGSGERYMTIAQAVTLPAQPLNRYGHATTNGTGLPTSLNVTATKRFSSGQQIAIYAYQSSSGALNTDASWNAVQISLTWVGY